MINAEILEFNRKELLYQAGEKLALKEFKNISLRNLKEALEKLADIYSLEEMGLIKVDGTNSKFIIIKIYNCATCSEAEKDTRMHCWFDAGYIAGALKTMMKKDFVAFEVECKAAGFEACKFIVTLKKPMKKTNVHYFINLKPMDKMPF